MTERTMNRRRNGRACRSRGDAAERAIVKLHKSMGVKAERMKRWGAFHLSGAARYRGNGADVDVHAFGPDNAPLVVEVKKRADGDGFVQLERWLGDADALFLKRNLKPPLVVLPWRAWQRFLARIAGRGGAHKQQAETEGGP